jgi:hypothetical protein
MKLPRVVFLVVTCALLLFITAAHGATIEFIATNLSDTTPGEDLWRYDYKVQGTFAQSQFFDIYFDPLLYGPLTAGPAPNSDWDAAILQQPNPANLPPFDRGMFDGFALVNNPSLAGTFSVTFVYLGSGTPGSQPFEVFDADSNLLADESGFTFVIPEPSTLMLVSSAGLAVIGIRFYRTHKSRR